MEALGIARNPADVGFYSGVSVQTGSSARQRKLAWVDLSSFPFSIEGAFATAQIFTVYGWGSLSDRIGRKPVILIGELNRFFLREPNADRSLLAGLLGVACSILLFGGLSNSFWGMVFARGLNGLLSGNASVIKAALGEVTDSTNEGLAFPLFSLQWSLGLVLG